MFNSRQFIYFILTCLSSMFLTIADEWYSKSQCTQKEYANHMDIECGNKIILIGWSHYGTKKRSTTNQQESQRCEPLESDCIMDYTHKIAELCNGVSLCQVILTQQFIHKCSDEATYLFISYQCIANNTIIDICSKRSLESSTELHLITPSFPNEYPNNVNCTCSVSSTDQSSSQQVTIDVESLSFNLQDNDFLSTSTSISQSGTLSFGSSIVAVENHIDLTFTTDETLSQSGFWIRLHGYSSCGRDEYSLGSKCLRLFTMKHSWTTAREKCLSIGSRLLKLYDIVEEKKLLNFLTNGQYQDTQYWIGLYKNSEEWLWDTKQNKKFSIKSWWPWRTSTPSDDKNSDASNCVLRTQDGWVKKPCENAYAFICERDTNRELIPLSVRCGNAQQRLFPSPTTTTTTSSSIPLLTTTTIVSPVSKVQLPLIKRTRRPNLFNERANNDNNSPNLNNEVYISQNQQLDPLEVKKNELNVQTQPSTTKHTIDPTILAAVLGGVAIAIFSVNIVVCYICRKRSQKQSKCKTPVESQSSFTHEELQRSLMQHLYHEQTNTISSTSSSSNHSQSQSNDTTRTTTGVLSAPPITPILLGSTSSPNNNTNFNLLTDQPTSFDHQNYTLTKCPQHFSSYPTSNNHRPGHVVACNGNSGSLCFRNPHADLNTTQNVDYHVYETIPSSSTTDTPYMLHSAFKPVLQGQTQTIRPFLPRTNIIYRNRQQPLTTVNTSPYDTSTINSSTKNNQQTVLIPVCCGHHHLSLPSHPQQLCCNYNQTSVIPSQISNSNMPRSNVEQIYVGSESIV